MPSSSLTLDGLEVATSELSSGVDDAAPCSLLGVIREPPSTKHALHLAQAIGTGALSGLTLHNIVDLSFLRKFPGLRYLEIQSDSKVDVTHIAGLDSLRGLRLDKPASGLDFSAWPLLEAFVGDWHPNNTNLTQSSLRRLALWQFKPLSRDFSSLVRLTSLTNLAVTQSNVTTLAGLEHLEDLYRLELSYAPTVDSLTPLASPNLALRELDLDHLKSITSYEPLARLHYLKKLKVSACTPIQSLDWIRRHPRLRFFSFVDTNVVSGDLTPLLDVPNLRYVGTLDKRHYSHKCDALNELLNARTES